MTGARGLAVALTVGYLLAGCGVPAQDEPHPVTLPRRPLDVSAAPTASEPAGGVAQVLCLIRDDRLVETVRRSGTLLGPQRQLDLLVSGPTAAEQAQGLTTSLAATVLRVTVPVPGTTAVVEISDPEEGGGRIDEVLAYGQIVCTLTARPDISGVTFVRDGKPLQVPDGDGAVTGSPLTVADYRSRIGPP